MFDNDWSSAQRPETALTEFTFKGQEPQEQELECSKGTLIVFSLLQKEDG